MRNQTAKTTPAETPTSFQEETEAVAGVKAKVEAEAVDPD
jgi:hypothetical protein